MSKYNLYNGQFLCHTCKKTVATARFYYETKDLTWMCHDRHMSVVSFNTKKKSKKDYEREK